MTKTIKILKDLILIILLVFTFTTTAQVGIGTITPSGGSLLDLTSTNKGFLVPRVNIVNLNTIAPVTGGATTGLLVWNTRAATGVGYHYWNGSIWVPLGSKGDDWSLAGNALVGGEFLGTTSNDDLDIRTNNAESMRVQANGQTTVGFGAGAANAGDQFSSVGTFAVNGYSGGTGVGVYGQNIGGGDGVWGLNSSTGNGVYGLATATGIGVRGEAGSNIASLGISTSNSGVQGQSTSASGVVGFGATAGTLGIVTGGVGAEGDATTGDGVRGFSTSGEGVYGDTDSGVGVWGTSATFDAVWGIAGNGDGVYGQSTNGVGVYGTSANFDAVWGIAGNGDGVYGQTTSGVGVYGIAGDDAAYAGRFFNSGALGHGIVATGNNGTAIVIPGAGAGATASGETLGSMSYANAANSNGAVGTANGNLTYFTNPYGNGSGVAGTGNDMGVYGYGTTTTSIGVMGDGGTAAGGEGVNGLGFDGVAGYTTNVVLGYGVYSYGDLGTTGNTYATGTKFFRIDHPLDPANKYLRHASIESNEVLNLYRGKETFGEDGRVIVELPDYYDAINKNASYQLTPIGAAMPYIYIEKEIENGSFIIAGGVAGKKVSWQLTAERNDPYLQQNPDKREMEVDKGHERGTYLTPELYGVSEELSTRNRSRARFSEKRIGNESNAVSMEKLEKSNKVENIKEVSKKEVAKEKTRTENVEMIEKKADNLDTNDSKNSNERTKAVITNSSQE